MSKYSCNAASSFGSIRVRSWLSSAGGILSQNGYGYQHSNMQLHRTNGGNSSGSSYGRVDSDGMNSGRVGRSIVGVAMVAIVVVVGRSVGR